MEMTWSRKNIFKILNQGTIIHQFFFRLKADLAKSSEINFSQEEDGSTLIVAAAPKANIYVGTEILTVAGLLWTVNQLAGMASYGGLLGSLGVAGVGTSYKW